MRHSPVEVPFSRRISRSLALAVGVMVAAVLAIGGISLFLAHGIYQNNEAVSEAYGQILEHDRLHSVFDDLIFELQQRSAAAVLLQEDLAQQLDALTKSHPAKPTAAPGEREHAAVADLLRLGEKARELTARLTAGSGRLPESDLEWLERATHEVPRCVEALEYPHHVRITGLLEDSQRRVHAIVTLYLAFTLVGGGLVVAAGASARRAITVPLRRLAEAAQGIATGHLDTRVRVRSANEIGQLSQAFNVMAQQLQDREHELRSTHAALEARVRETQALYRIGTEISRLHQPDRILQSVVEKARELLRCDAATLCLCGPGGEGLVARATSGPPEAFRPGTDIRCGLPAPGAEGPPCPAIEPEYRRGHVSAVLRLGDVRVGEIHATTREAREFTAAETELLEGLATQAAIAIERARLTEELHSLATVQERERLAREMHDGLAQALGLLHLKLQSALALSTGDPAVAEHLREMLHITEDAYEEVRQSIFGLRTFVSRGLGLVPTLTEYLHEFSAHSGVSVELETEGAPLDPIPPASEVQAVRIIQEALTNVRKHAAAERARVRLQKDGAWLRVTVEDDGIGWDRQRSLNGLHFGLQTMRERAEGLGGRLEIEAAPGRGTRVVATLPGGGV